MLQLQIRNFRPNSYIVMEGKPENDQFYIIQKGQVQCFKASGRGMKPFMLGPGDFVGVVPCMTGHSQVETAIAMTDVMAIAVKREQYTDLIVNNTPVALKIIKTFASRMRQMNEMLTKATLNSVSNNSREGIFDVAQFYEKQMRNNIAVYAYYQYLKTKPTGPNAEIAAVKFKTLKPRTQAVYFENTADPVREYPADTMIFSDEQSGQDMFIIQRGEVAISKVINGNEVIFSILHKGDMFGEMALLENKPRSASAIAHTDCRLMVVNLANFNQMVSTQPQMIGRLTTTLAERLWSMYRQLDNANLTDPYHKMLDMVSLQLEKQKVNPDKLLQKSMQTDLTPKDIANLCGIPGNQQGTVIADFQTSSHFRIVDGKIFIKDIPELMKQSAFFRSQSKDN